MHNRLLFLTSLLVLNINRLLVSAFKAIILCKGTLIISGPPSLPCSSCPREEGEYAPLASSKEPLPLDKVIAGVGGLYNDTHKEPFPVGVAERLRKMAEDAKSNEEETREMITFVENRKKLSQKRVEVPDGVMLEAHTAHLVDIKVDVKGKPDDVVYRKNHDIRERIPRGLTVLQMEGKKDTTVIYGFKKFSGGIGDEDENQPETNDQWRDYCTADPDTAKEIVCISKLNGEAAHFSGRYIDGQFYLFVGSKNVHIMVRNKADIYRYTGQRYQFATVIAKEVYESLSRLSDHKQHVLFSLLHHTRCTVVGEILQPDSQHIVNLSHLSKPQLVVISFTPTVSTCSTPGASLTALPPHQGINIAKSLGLETAPYTIIDFIDFMDQRMKVRSMTQDEGEVWYLLNDQKNTIGLIKVKTAWYTVLRALREKAVYCFTAAKKKPGWSLQDRIKSTHKRFNEIQNWLKFSDDYLHQWKRLAEKYMRWLEVEVNEGRINPGSIRPSFPVTWKKFMDATNYTDEILLTIS